jgi:iron complex outermembrane receptor protein
MPRRSGLTLLESFRAARKPGDKVGRAAASGLSREQARSCTVALATFLAVGLDPVVASAQLAADATQEVRLDELTVQGTAGPRLVADGYLAKQSVSATRTDTPPARGSPDRRRRPEPSVRRRGRDPDRHRPRPRRVGRANNFAGLGLSEFTIRGFATGEYYRNGFPINRGYPNSPDIASIERVEVLKGPSAFLYGRGDPGGTFNIVSKQPLAERTFAVGTQYGSFNTKRSTFDATGAVSEDGTVLARITGAVEDNGSFRDFVSSDRYYVAPAIAWRPTADTTITLEGELISAGQIFDRGIVPFRGNVLAVPRSRYIGEPASRRSATITRSASCASSTGSIPTGC